MKTLAFNFLGKFEANLDGQVVSGFESDKVRLLLAYLAIEADQPHRREHLAGLMWPESSENKARQSLNQALYNLRQVLCPNGEAGCLDVTPKEVRFLHREGISVDVHRFLDLLRTVQTHAHAQVWSCRSCLMRLDEGVQLYHSELLVGFSLEDAPAFEIWLLEQRQYQNRLAFQALEILVKSNVRRGNLDQALAYAERLATLDPLDEVNLRQWITLLAQKGWRNKALEQYAAFEQYLGQELQVKPEAETVALVDRIRHHFKAFTVESKPPNNLPIALTPFVGRETELEDLYWKLVDPNCRLLTILGMGGCGKTRLALEVGKALLPAFPDGVFMVELGAFSSGHDLLPVIARTLGVRINAFYTEQDNVNLLEQVIDHLKDKELLLILDSVEIVLEGIGFVVELLHRLPGVKVLATSRARLNFKAENLFYLAGLPYPVTASAGWQNFPAMRLFTEAARRVHPKFIASEDNAAVLVEICKLVQGTPLALLLAAAWVSAFPPTHILDEMRSSLDFLAVSWHDLPPRQQSLRAAFDYSWNLLWQEEKDVLCRLSIFQQPFTSEQASLVGMASPHHLSALLGFSLLQATEDGRYRMHDLVRQYALEKLIDNFEESRLVHKRFSSFFIKKLVGWEKGLKSSQQAIILNEMDLAIENTRLAWDWLVAQDYLGELEGALEGLCTYYELRRQPKSGESACNQGLAGITRVGLGQENLLLWARLASWQGYFFILQGNHLAGLDQLDQVGRELEKEAWSGLDTRWERAQALFFIQSAKTRRDNHSAIQLACRSLDLFQGCGECWYVARDLIRMGEALESLGRYREQIAALEQAIDLLKPDGAPNLIQTALYVLGCGLAGVGDQERTAQVFREILSLSDNPRTDEEVIQVNIYKALSLNMSGEFQQALLFLDIAGTIYQELGIEFKPLYSLHKIVNHWGLGKYPEVERWVEVLIGTFFSGLGLVFLGAIHLLQGQNELAIATFTRSLELADQMTDRRSISLATPLLSIAYYRVGEVSKAHDFLRQAIEENQAGETLATNASLVAVVYYLLERGAVELAVEVFATVTKNRFWGKSAWTRDFIGARLDRAALELTASVVAAAQTRGQALKANAVAADWLGKIEQLLVAQPAG